GVWQINNADVSSLVDGDISFTASTIDVAGNPTSVSTIVSKDSQASVTIEAVDDDNTLNAVEVPTTTLRGEALNIEDGQNVLIWVTDSSGTRLIFNTTVVDGLWQLDNLDLSSLLDGELTLRALAVDVEGNPSIGNNTVAKDTVADITVEIIDNDGVINAVEMTQVVIQGSVTNVEDGQTVTVFLTDNQGQSLTLTSIVTGGVWTLAAQDLSAFDDGSLEVTAEVSDVAGNPATATTQLPVDTTALIDITIVDNDNVINTVEMTLVVIQGSVTNVEDGQTVTVFLT
ncbi:Ig-like domain-containing protein, partial [Shewanella olleyana]|uniref:Ig-like domain-containing protein n=1 Tax=Shewanella olleyana TaxID=135626 RepID=UPI00200E867B